MTDRVYTKSEVEQASYRIRDSAERPMIHMRFHINDKMQQHIYLSLEEAPTLRFAESRKLLDALGIHAGIRCRRESQS